MLQILAMIFLYNRSAKLLKLVVYFHPLITDDDSFLQISVNINCGMTYCFENHLHTVGYTHHLYYNTKFITCVPLSLSPLSLVCRVYSGVGLCVFSVCVLYIKFCVVNDSICVCSLLLYWFSHSDE